MLQYQREIVDGIIDYVRGASGGHFSTPIKSCALVSKAWHPRSQFHLFRLRQSPVRHGVQVVMQEYHERKE